MNSEQTCGREFVMLRALIACCIVIAITGCGGGAPTINGDATAPQIEQDYVIGPGDQLEVFVWGHEDLSTQVQVRPDGEMSTPLVEDLRAAGKTPTELARTVETALSDYVRSPTVT